MATFIKAARSEEASFLDMHPIANHLLNVIARRARRTKCNLTGLDIGECFLGHKGVGMTEQQYRTAKKNLKKWGLAEFKRGERSTDRGTVAKLVTATVYDINITEGNGKVTEAQRKSNGSPTTNKECKNVNNVNKELIEDGFQHWWGLYPPSRRTDKKGCLEKFKSKCKKLNDDQIADLVNIISSDIVDRKAKAEDVKYIPQTTAYLNKERWNDGE